MSLYSFIYGINPEYKEILKSIKVVGENIKESFTGMDLSNYFVIPRFRDVYYRNGIISIVARIGGKEKEKYMKTYQEIKNNKDYYRNVDFHPLDHYTIFEFKKELNVKRYNLERKVFIDSFKTVHQTRKQQELMLSIFKKIESNKKFNEQELKRTPYDVTIITNNPNYGNAKNKTINITTLDNLKNYNLNSQNTFIILIDREDILNVININKDIKFKIK